MHDSSIGDTWMAYDELFLSGVDSGRKNADGHILVILDEDRGIFESVAVIGKIPPRVQ
jgi:hypothetical protein